MVIDFRCNEDERKMDKIRVEDETMVKFRDDWRASYAPESFIILPYDEIMQETIKKIESKYT